MGQELLNLDVAANTSLKEKKSFAGTVSEQGKQDTKPFSSTLNEQVEKQNNHADKKLSDASVQKKEQNNNTATETEDLESGNNLPLENNSDVNELILEIDVDAETVSERDLPDVNIAGEESTETVIPITSSLVPNQSENAGKEQDIANNKKSASQSTVIKDEKNIVTASANNIRNEAAPVVEQQIQTTTPILRSDILHAITKKQAKNEQVGLPFVDKDNQKMAKGILTTPTLDDQLSEDQKMAKLIGQMKSEPLVLRAVNDRGVEGFSAAAHKIPAFAASSSNAAPIAASSSAPTVLAMQPSVQSEAWGKVLSSRVVWMAKEGIQRAELKLNPARLGPVEVRMSTQNDQISVSFIAQHSATRDALEQALPKLKESFQENGIDLAQADVSQQEQGQEEDGSGAQSGSTNHAVGDENEQEDSGHTVGTAEELELGVSVFA